MKNVNPNLQNDPRFKGLTDFLKTGRQGVVVPSPAAPSAAPAGAAAPASTTPGTASSGGSGVAVSSSGSTPTTLPGVVPSSSSAAAAPAAAPARSAPSAAPAASTPKPGVWSKLAGNPYLGSTVGAGLGALAGGLGLGGFGAAAGAKIGGAAGGAISNAYKSYKNSSNKGWKRFGDTLKGAGKGALKGLGIGSVASGVGGAVADGIGDYMSNQIPDDSIPQPEPVTSQDIDPEEVEPSAVPAATQKQGFGDPEAGKEEWRKPVEDDPALTPVQNARKRPWASGRGGANQLMRGF
jgi:hypothetical protein